MSISIFDNNDFAWSSATTYIKNDIVKYLGVYWYALAGSSNSAPSLTNTNWGGQLIDDNAEQKPYFFWDPAYNFSNNHEPKNKTIAFSDGYSQIIKEGINNQLLNLDINFDNRSLVEITAILHFLYARGGIESFLFLAPTPHNKRYRFRCPQWTDTCNFYDNYSVKCKFIQTPV